MRYFAHIFIGREFADLAAGMGRAVLRGDAQASGHLSYYVVDAEGEKFSFRKMVVSSEPESSSGLVRNIGIDWEDGGEVDGGELAAYWQNEIFDRILTRGNATRNGQLFVFLHFPFYKEEAVKTLMSFHDAIVAAGRPTSLDFVGYCDDLAGIVEPDYKIVSPSRKQAAMFAKLRDERRMAIDKHLIVLQNSSYDGISLGLDLEALAEIQAQFALACGHYYNEIFPATAQYRDVVSFGLSTLCLDKYLFVDYLLQRTLLAAMDNSSVNDSEIDIDYAGSQVDLLLKDSATLLSDFLRKFDAAPADSAEFAATQQFFKDEAAEIIERCKKTFASNRGITAKAVILAAMLSKTECELFSQTVFDPDHATMDDLFSEAIDYFIANDKTGVYHVDDQPLENPIKALRALNTKTINSESEVRSLQHALAGFEKQLDEIEKVGACYFEDGFCHFNEQRFRLLPHLDEEPLDETYAAHEQEVQSVDLRKNFTPVKNQGQQGSCLAHALTAIFEYLLKSNRAAAFDLSEAFLYYNARELDKSGDVSTGEDAGSRFHPAIESLKVHGLALERLCPYDEGVYDRKPSEEAYRDAAGRRLIKALNVNRTANDIRSALADGYPVAVSLMLCESFCPAPGGYIPMPAQTEIDAQLAKSDGQKDRHSNHAMVIVGYSDALNMFVVRNSWGAEWGDAGYCYVPYGYIDHPDLCTFACILTEVESLPAARSESVPSLTIDNADVSIQYHLAKASLDKEQQALSGYRRERDALRFYLEKLKNMISADPNKRDVYIEQTTEALSEEKKSLCDSRTAIRRNLEIRWEAFRKYRRRMLLRTGAAMLVAWVIFFAYNRLCGYLYELHEWGIDLRIGYKWLFIAFAAIAVVTFVLGNRYWRQYRELRDDDEAKIRKLDRAISAKESEIAGFKAKTFAAWNLMRSMSQVQNYLQSQYNALISLINNLRAWYRELEASNRAIELATNLPNTSLLDKKTLDVYFEEKLKDDAICCVTFCEGIERHEISEEYLRGYKKQLSDGIGDRLAAQTLLGSFDITEQAIDGRFSDISLPITREVVAEADVRSDLFMQVRSLERPEIMRSSCICAPSLNSHGTKLKQALRKFSDCYLESADKDRIVFIKTAALSFDECVVLKTE